MTSTGKGLKLAAGGHQKGVIFMVVNGMMEGKKIQGKNRHAKLGGGGGGGGGGLLGALGHLQKECH